MPSAHVRARKHCVDLDSQPPKSPRSGAEALDSSRGERPLRVIGPARRVVRLGDRVSYEIEIHAENRIVTSADLELREPCDGLVPIRKRRRAIVKQLRDRSSRSLPRLEYARRPWEVRHRRPVTIVSLEQPGAAFLARHLAAEKPLDHLSMRTDEHRERKLIEEPEACASRGIGCKLVPELDLETSRVGEPDDRFHAAPVRTRDDPLDRGRSRARRTTVSRQHALPRRVDARDRETRFAGARPHSHV